MSDFSEHRVTVHVGRLDDCDQASLAGMIRDALLATDRGRNLIARAGGTITVTTEPVMRDRPYVVDVTPPLCCWCDETATHNLHSPTDMACRTCYVRWYVAPTTAA